MTGREAHRRIAKARSRIAELKPWVGELRERREALVLRATDPDDDRARSELAAVEHGPQYGAVYDERIAARFAEDMPGLRPAEAELAKLHEQVEALEAELPSDEEIDAARKKIGELEQRVEEHVATADKTWSRLRHHLERAERSARQIADERAGARAAVLEALEAAEQAGIDYEHDEALWRSAVGTKLRRGWPALPSSSRELALQASLVSSVAQGGGLDSTAAKSLSNTRRRAAKDEEAA